MPTCFFVSDLHGDLHRYHTLFRCIEEECPAAVFMGGDLLPGLSAWAVMRGPAGDFIHGFLHKELSRLRSEMQNEYPQIFTILGNDDSMADEPAVKEIEAEGLWHYVNQRRIELNGYSIYGYAFVPPTPFLMKDWERYDVSRHVDPGCVPPTEGWRSVPAEHNHIEYATIADDLKQLTGDDEMERAVFLFHSPPYQTKLDRAALDGLMIDYVPLDVNIGSIAIQRFIKSRQPWITFHGHVHESARLTGSWVDKIGRTTCFSAAHDGQELALVRLDLDYPEEATRELL